MSRIIRVAILGALMWTAACSGFWGKPLGKAGELATVEGQVGSINVTPMAADGPAEIELISSENGRVLIKVQSCLGGCSLQAVQALQVMHEGLRWRAVGEVQAEGHLLLYLEGPHRLEPLDR